eukprot:scaffold216499_cov39-Prasinocladus_malaysianus.AAC.1
MNSAEEKHRPFIVPSSLPQPLEVGETLELSPCPSVKKCDCDVSFLTTYAQLADVCPPRSAGLHWPLNTPSILRYSTSDDVPEST